MVRKVDFRKNAFLPIFHQKNIFFTTNIGPQIFLLVLHLIRRQRKKYIEFDNKWWVFCNLAYKNRLFWKKCKFCPFLRAPFFLDVSDVRAKNLKWQTNIFYRCKYTFKQLPKKKFSKNYYTKKKIDLRPPQKRPFFWGGVSGI